MLYQMWMIQNTAAGNKALAQQSDAVREEQNQALVAAHRDTGARPLIVCESGWANEEYSLWGVTRFPDLNSRVMHYQAMEKFGFYQYYESFTLLGTAMEEPQLANIQPGIIYSLWMVRTDPAARAAYKALSQTEEEALWSNHQSISDRLGRCMILRCQSYWANDAFWGFGVEAYPSLEAAQEFKAETLNLDWPLYIPASSILGTLSPMQSTLATLLGPDE